MILSLPLVVLSVFATEHPENGKNEGSKPLILYIGTYTQGSESKGIYTYEMNPVTGALTFKNYCETPDPSYLVIHPNRKWLYAVNELGGDKPGAEGRVSAFKIDPVSHQLKLINSVPSGGAYPCYISLDTESKFAMVANYGSGTVAVYPVNVEGGLKEASCVQQHVGKGSHERQEGPHAHMIIPGKGKFIYSNDLGNNKTQLYVIDKQGTLELKKEMEANTGAGPRHLVFHPAQPWVYVVNELNGTVEASKVNPVTGDFTRFQTISTLPEEQNVFAGCADIHLSPSGKYLYASNRGEVNTIAIYSVNQVTGELTVIGQQPVKGKTPRNFVIDPTGTFLLVANQGTNNVVTFRIDSNTGKLVDTGIQTEVPKPVCLKFL